MTTVSLLMAFHNDHVPCSAVPAQPPVLASAPLLEGVYLFLLLFASFAMGRRPCYAIYPSRRHAAHDGTQSTRTWQRPGNSIAALMVDMVGMERISFFLSAAYSVGKSQVYNTVLRARWT